MAEIVVEEHFSASPDELWKRVGEPGDVASWIPAIATSRLEGDIRHVVFADGEPARERIVVVDHDARSYTYEYIDGPLPLSHYSSTIRVDEEQSGSLITWSASFGADDPEVEAGLVEAIRGIYTDALAELGRQTAG